MTDLKVTLNWFEVEAKAAHQAYKRSGDTYYEGHSDAYGLAADRLRAAIAAIDATAAPVVVGEEIKIVESDAIPPGLVVLTQNGKPIATIRCCTCHDERQKELCLNKHECVQVTAALAGD